MWSPGSEFRLATALGIQIICTLLTGFQVHASVQTTEAEKKTNLSEDSRSQSLIHKIMEKKNTSNLPSQTLKLQINIIAFPTLHLKRKKITCQFFVKSASFDFGF
jgi:hypothetical protein